MKGLFANLRSQLVKFMQGRNGADSLASASLVAGATLAFLDCFVGSGLLSVLGTAALFYSMFRCYSKDIVARTRENDRFVQATERLRGSFSGFSRRWASRKTTKYLKCPQCGQRLSVPRGKGAMRVTCPKCKAQKTIKS